MFIHLTFNVRLGIHLIACLSQNGVLVALELTAVVTLLVRVGADSESLRARTAGVDEVDVVHFQVGSPSPQCGGKIIVGRVILALALCDSDSVRCKAARVGSLSVDCEG